MKTPNPKSKGTRHCSVRLHHDGAFAVWKLARSSGMSESRIVSDCVRIAMSLDTRTARPPAAEFFQKWREEAVKNNIKARAKQAMKQAMQRLRKGVPPSRVAQAA